MLLLRCTLQASPTPCGVMVTSQTIMTREAVTQGCLRVASVEPRIGGLGLGEFNGSTQHPHRHIHGTTPDVGVMSGWMAHLIRACLSLLAVIVIAHDPLTHASMSGHAAANLVNMRAIYGSTA